MFPKSSRRFDAEQVFGIGLLWMLSKSGLRAEVIKEILCDITESEVAIARDAAQVLLQTGHPFLVVLREMPVPREAEPAEDANLTTKVCYLDQIPELLGKNVGKSALVFPIGDLFDGIESGINLVKRLQERQGG